MLSAQKVWFLWLYATFLFAGGRLFAESGHGVKVEQVAEKSAATVAGLQEGDVIISWRRGDANGEIESPFDLRVVEIEQRPRGSVTLTGFRGDEKRQWELGANDWSVSARPMLPEPLLSSYRDGEKLADAGKAPEGAEQWSRIASEVKEPDSSVVRLWLLSHSAELLAKKQQWKQADNFYQQAIQQTAGARPEIAAMLLADWASTFQKRNDWANAEKYYQQSM